MRRAERQVTDLETIGDIVRRCKVVRIGLEDAEGPYIVPVNFGYEMSEDGRLVLYIHSAGEGRKVKAFCAGRPVAVEMDCSHELVAGELPCQFSYLYQSLIGVGEPKRIADVQDKKDALNKIMLHQSGKEFVFTDDSVSGVEVFEILIGEYTVKQYR